MAAFAKPTYTFSTYATFRPAYPPSLYIRLHLYHSPTPSTTHLDLGTGPGTILSALSPPFTRTYAVDPSPPMLALAQSSLPSRLKSSTTFHPSSAEDLSFLPPSSMSLITAAQSAHWFRTPDIWDSLARVSLRPEGTVAFWGYKDPILPSFPNASFILNKYAYGSDLNHWGTYWGEPGRRRQGRLRALRPPNDGRWERVERWEYEPSFTPTVAARTGITWPERVLPETREEAEAYGPGIFGELVYRDRMLMKEMKIWELEEYVRTWSAVHDWIEKNPDSVRLKDGGKGDSVDECFAEMRDAEGWVDKARRLGLEWKELAVEVEWGHGMLFCKRTAKE